MLAEFLGALELLATTTAFKTFLRFHGSLLLTALKEKAIRVGFHSDQPLRVAPVLQFRVCHNVFPITKS